LVINVKLIHEARSEKHQVIHLVFGRCRSSVSEILSNGLLHLLCTLSSQCIVFHCNGMTTLKILQVDLIAPAPLGLWTKRNPLFISVRNVRQQSQKM